MNSHPIYLRAVSAEQWRAAREAAGLLRHVRREPSAPPVDCAPIAEAQAEERRRIERDLHDGAQQRLLALALRLATANQRADLDRLRDAVAHGITEVLAALDEIRDLANGIRPACLTSRGLRAALAGLAARAPVPVAVHAVGDRFDAAVEATMWFVVAEAVTNALSHAGAAAIEIDLFISEDHLVLVVTDDGIGGADLEGNGLQGLINRVEALGGWLAVESPPGRGTMVRAELPLAPLALSPRRAARA